MEKQKPSNQKTEKRPVNIFNFKALVDAIKAKMQSSSMGSGGAQAIVRGGYHTYSGYGSGNFKRNQRKERSRSRRRNMKTSARN